MTNRGYFMNKGALWNKIEKAFDVQIEHPVHFSRQQSVVQSIQRLMLASPWSEPVRKSKKIRFVDSVQQDRKSTRLNSSHSQISYAVFCLKKKKKHQKQECLL